MNKDSKRNKLETINKRYDRMEALEKLRHQNIMNEIRELKLNGIKSFNRVIIKTLKGEK